MITPKYTPESIRILEKLPLCYACGEQMEMELEYMYGYQEYALVCKNYKEHPKERSIIVYFHTEKWKQNIWDKTIRRRNKGHIVTS